jgi:hypothetical protein
METLYLIAEEPRHFESIGCFGKPTSQAKVGLLEHYFASESLERIPGTFHLNFPWQFESEEGQVERIPCDVDARRDCPKRPAESLARQRPWKLKKPMTIRLQSAVENCNYSNGEAAGSQNLTLRHCYLMDTSGPIVRTRRALYRSVPGHVQDAQKIAKIPFPGRFSVSRPPDELAVCQEPLVSRFSKLASLSKSPVGFTRFS